MGLGPPYYVHNSPSPKATLSLLDKIEELADVTVPRGSLLDEATEWEEGIDALAADDEDMASYIGQLEQARDTVDSPRRRGTRSRRSSSSTSADASARTARTAAPPAARVRGGPRSRRSSSRDHGTDGRRGAGWHRASRPSRVGTRSGRTTCRSPLG